MSRWYRKKGDDDDYVPSTDEDSDDCILTEYESSDYKESDEGTDDSCADFVVNESDDETDSDVCQEEPQDGPKDEFMMAMLTNGIDTAFHRRFENEFLHGTLCINQGEHAVDYLALCRKTYDYRIEPLKPFRGRCELCTLQRTLSLKFTLHTKKERTVLCVGSECGAKLEKALTFYRDVETYRELARRYLSDLYIEFRKRCAV